SKIGHVRLIGDEHITRLLHQFESTDPPQTAPIGYRTGTLSLATPSEITAMVTVDGGQAVVSNDVVPAKRLGFIKIGTLVITDQQLQILRDNPVMDPRERTRVFEHAATHESAVVPLSGIRMPGETVRETIRKTIDRVIGYTRLYPVLLALVNRSWNPSYSMDPQRNQDAPHFNCVSCDANIWVPCDKYIFSCLSCGATHTLSDYLAIGQDTGEEWAREEIVMSLRNVMETLTLFQWVLRCYQEYPHALPRMLFLKDGPLLLRANLSRLVEPIRDLIGTIRRKGHTLHLIGIEKNGQLVDHINEIQTHLPDPGDFFLPSIQYLMEQIAGVRYEPTTYRDRVQYGTKVVVRLGPHHVLPLHIGTERPITNPVPADLPGLKEIATTLSGVLSYSHDNALIPIKLANDSSSLSERPSGDILKRFVEQILGH
ncbi:MAG: hypothetical protein H0U67_12920, partial [Gemmatimonadetes bacterium]|nr:hypothetical protein [Gemmatimonadota bacterium]